MALPSDWVAVDGRNSAIRVLRPERSKELVDRVECVHWRRLSNKQTQRHIAWREWQRLTGIEDSYVVCWATWYYSLKRQRARSEVRIQSHVSSGGDMSL
jgi:hypothetical protein